MDDPYRVATFIPPLDPAVDVRTPINGLAGKTGPEERRFRHGLLLRRKFVD